MTVLFYETLYLKGHLDYLTDNDKANLAAKDSFDNIVANLTLEVIMSVYGIYRITFLC